MGPIPAGYEAAADGALAVAGRSVVDWVADAGSTPLFLYDSARIAAQAARFRAAFPDRIALHYAVKANPYAPLLAAMDKIVDGFDLASAGELWLLRGSGTDKPISMAGPGKSDADLDAAIEAGATLNLESEREAARALARAGALDKPLVCAVRVNPPFALKGAGMKMGGLASPFGVDAARVPALVQKLVAEGADWRGFHVYGGSQLLHADVLIEAQRETISLVAALAEKAGHAPREVNLGGGFGIPYAPGDAPLDVEAVGAALAKTLDAAPAILAATAYAIELGRWLVGEAGVYLTRVVDVKESGGKRFAITDGGLQHMLAATGNFGQLLRRNYPLANASRFDDKSLQEVSVTGCLCTPLDLLGDEVILPETRVDDLVAVFCAGAYGLSASPQGFLSQPQARELLV